MKHPNFDECLRRAIDDLAARYGEKGKGFIFEILWDNLEHFQLILKISENKNSGKSFYEWQNLKSATTPLKSITECCGIN